jgi:hypothetical protein
VSFGFEKGTVKQECTVEQEDNVVDEGAAEVELDIDGSFMSCDVHESMPSSRIGVNAVSTAADHMTVWKASLRACPVGQPCSCAFTWQVQSIRHRAVNHDDGNMRSGDCGLFWRT